MTPPRFESTVLLCVRCLPASLLLLRVFSDAQLLLLVFEKHLNTPSAELLPAAHCRTGVVHYLCLPVMCAPIPLTLLYLQPSTLLKHGTLFRHSSVDNSNIN